MRRTLMTSGALALALGVAGMVMACDSEQAKQAAADTASSPQTMAETVYAKTLAATGCEKAAREAAYDAVLSATSCAKTAATAAQQAGMTRAGDETGRRCTLSDDAAQAAMKSSTTCRYEAKKAAMKTSTTCPYDGKKAAVAAAGKASCPYEAGEDRAEGVESRVEHDAVKTASNDSVVRVGASCPVSHSKTGEQAAVKAGSCAKSAGESAAETLAVETYAKTKGETGCAKTARTAAYEAVLASTGCCKTAERAARLAAAKAAYDETLKATGCAETAQKEYDRVATGSEPVQVAEAGVAQ